ncbi:MAG TPA: hypothetical protein VFW86_04930, partial [Candidatus Limnocylindrales bacterium]|nr:hypothetical protein [Candidatus Limnocylindrales bacterium]
QPPTARDVQYKGAPLDAAKGPGLGCFWFQLAAVAVLVILTPLSAVWGWPEPVSAGLLIATLILLLFAGQTVIFLLRLVAADRRAEARRRPLQPRTPTVGQIQDAERREQGESSATVTAPAEAADPAGARTHETGGAEPGDPPPAMRE